MSLPLERIRIAGKVSGSISDAVMKVTEELKKDEKEKFTAEDLQQTLDGIMDGVLIGSVHTVLAFMQSFATVDGISTEKEFEKLKDTFRAHILKQFVHVALELFTDLSFEKFSSRKSGIEARTDGRLKDLLDGGKASQETNDKIIDFFSKKKNDPNGA